MNLPGVPSALLVELCGAAHQAGSQRLALVGGAVRDGLLHRQHGWAWSGVPDLDLVVEGKAAAVAEALLQRCGAERLSRCVEHGGFGTVALTLDGQSLDLATARAEIYPAPGLNPEVRPGTLLADLVRRDFTINAMAWDLMSGELIDPHGGRQHLDSKQLVFLHQRSVSDDPTRLIRAARYGARLGFDLSPAAMEQVRTTLAAWPWAWKPGDLPAAAPPALSTRLRMELERLLHAEPWQQALPLLQRWGAMAVIDSTLQHDSDCVSRLCRGRRLGLPLLPVLLAGASRPAELAERLQIPGQQRQWLKQLPAARHWLSRDAPDPSAPPSAWTVALEAANWGPELVALLVSDRPAAWRPLLRWWGRWRHVRAPLSARELIAAGWQQGPELGAELRRRRLAALDQGR